MFIYYIYLRKYFVINTATKLLTYINEAYSFAINFLFSVVIILYVCYILYLFEEIIFLFISPQNY